MPSGVPFVLPGGMWERCMLPVAGSNEEVVLLGVQKCTGPDKFLPQMLRDVPDVFVRPFSVDPVRSW